MYNQHQINYKDLVNSQDTMYKIYSEILGGGFNKVQTE